jgi:hypothetical protein
MLNGLPFYIPLLFILTTFVTFIFFIAAVKRKDAGNRSVLVSFILIAWLSLHAILSMLGFYTVTNQTPPRFMILVAPPFLAILFFFVTRKGRKFIDTLSPEILTQLHVVRVFVEVVLLWLYMYKFIPRLMTFEGRNFDILAGVTAPFVAYYGFRKRRLSRALLIGWNIAALLLLINIVVNAILSAPFPFQKFAFDQPNIAVLYFPFVWLPSFIVPLVLFSHLVVLRRLFTERS